MDPITTRQISGWQRLGAWLLGMVAGIVAMVAICVVVTMATRSGTPGPQLAQLLVWPSFFLTPAIGGLIASYLWRRLRPRLGHTVLATLVMALLALGGTMVLLREGIICVLIVSPLLFVGLLAGALIGRVCFKMEPAGFRVTILPLLVFLTVGEPLLRTDKTGVVTDQLLIHASPAKIWAALTAFPEIPTPPAYWLFRLGLPYPRSTTVAGDFVGADRRCIFSGDAVFKETVVALVPGKQLTFDIIGIPPDPELIGHLTPRRGEFRLEDNGDGTTTLVGSTWYALHVRPLWYFDWWTHEIFRAVHRRVMDDIRLRAEAS